MARVVNKPAFVVYKLSLEEQVFINNQLKDLGLRLSHASLLKYIQEHLAVRATGEQLAGTKPNDNNSGIYLPDMNQERVETQSLMSDMYNGAGVPKSLRQTQKALNKSIATTNRANQNH